MLGKELAEAIESAAAPDRARERFRQVLNADGSPALPGISAEHVRILAALFSGSQVLGNLLVARPELLSSLEPERLRFPRRKEGLRNEVVSWLTPLLDSKDYPSALSRLRDFKQREMLRIAARDLARLGNVSEITRELSNVADVCLDAVGRVCHQQLAGRYGQPWHRDADGRWQPTEFCVLGMGKLGGQELNYSSDVDVLFVYSDEGEVFKEAPIRHKTPRAVLANHQFFNRLAEAFVAEVSRVTPDGTLFRIDLRLRPEGETGPLCRSLGSYENYYAQWGQTWERMMLIKARGVAGSPGLAAEFLEMIQPFRYPRAVSGDVVREVGAMKDRIENEVVRAGELDRNVKLGRGGIREIEFIVQSRQLLYGGKQPFLQGSQTLPILDKLAQYHLLEPEDAAALGAAYGFLRDVEHRLQMEENLQTHTIPTQPAAQDRLARLMGFAVANQFETARQNYTRAVRRIFDKLLKSEEASTRTVPFPREFGGAEEQWKKWLTEHSFREPDRAFHVLREFVEGPGYVHVSPRTVDLAHSLLAKLFELCPTAGTMAKRRDPNAKILSDPDRVVTRLDSFVTAYRARSVLFELWNSNPSVFELLLLLFDRSEFLAELAIRTPDMVDELVTSGRLRQRKTADETRRDLLHGLEDQDQHLWLRRYHQTELMRIGLRDILGLADFEQYLTELSALADACLEYALDVVMRKNRIKKPPFAVIGLGKLGGVEIDYGSDLDVVFVADSKAADLRKLQRLALEFMDLLSLRTEMGLVFHVDARLRPDGEKGLLVNTLAAYENYYRQRAQLWEIQSLTRTRPIAGDAKLGEKFQKLAATLTDFSTAEAATRPPNENRKPATQNAGRVLPACFTPDWRDKIHKMRLRIEKERTPAGQDDLAIKTGKGGLMDAEFVAQTLCMEKGWQEANTLRALERGRETAVIVQTPDRQRNPKPGKRENQNGTARPDADDFEKLIRNYRQLRRVEGILRRWSYEGETVLPDDPAPYYRVSVRCGFETPDAFRQALAAWREAIREVYIKIFASGRSG